MVFKHDEKDLYEACGVPKKCIEEVANIFVRYTTEHKVASKIVEELYGITKDSDDMLRCVIAMLTAVLIRKYEETLYNVFIGGSDADKKNVH